MGRHYFTPEGILSGGIECTPSESSTPERGESSAERIFLTSEHSFPSQIKGILFMNKIPRSRFSLDLMRVFHGTAAAVLPSHLVMSASHQGIGHDSGFLFGGKLTFFYQYDTCNICLHL